MDKHIRQLKEELQNKQNEIDEIKNMAIADVDTKETISEKLSVK